MAGCVCVGGGRVGGGDGGERYVCLRVCGTLSCALQASSCTQKEDKDCKYQKKSLAGGLVCKL